jgi:thiamine kinase-like enzyme
VVFTHGDISLNNVRLGRDGTLWLLDWEFSGAYPESFEYSCIMTYELDQSIPRDWLRLAPVIAGEHQSNLAFLRRIRWALVNFAYEEQ